MYQLEDGVEWTDNLKNKFRHGITKGKIRHYDDNNQEVIIDYDNGLKFFKLYDEKNIPGQGFIGQATSRQVDLELLDTINATNLENKEFELFLGVDRLPEEYQEVEYIKTDGNQYIDTGFMPNQDTRVIVDIIDYATSTAFIYGARAGGNTKNYNFLTVNNSNFRTDYDSTRTNMARTKEIRYVIDKNKNITTMYQNGVEINTVTHTYNNFNPNQSMYLFANNNNGTLYSALAKIDLFSCKIYDNGTLVRDFVPCYRKLDNVIGLYDLVNDVFYTNKGTGTFAKGNNIDNTYNINYGKFIVNQAPESDTTNGTIKITAFDYMIKTNKDYIPNVTFPCTLRAVAEDVCTQTGLELGSESFANEDFIVDSNQFDGKTCREVLKHIAKCAFSWARIGQDNKLHFDFTVPVSANIEMDPDEYYQDSFKKANEYYGPINRVVYAESNIQGQEEKVEDAVSIALNGLHELVIYDNYFAYTTEKRQELIQAGRRLFGLKFMPFQELKMVGFAYMDCQDYVEIEDTDENLFYTIPLNHIIEYTGAVQDSLSSETNSDNETVYKNTNAPINANSLIEIIVNRAMREIRMIVDQYVNFLHNKTGNNNIFIDGTRTGEGYITKFVVKGNSTYFTQTNITIVASEGIKNQETVLITEDENTILTESEDSLLAENKTLYIAKKQITLDEVLRSLTIDDVTYYDELQILQDGTIQVVRRIGIASDIPYLLDEEEITVLDTKFVLPSNENGLYYFVEELNNLDYYAEYIIKNEYSDIYATEAYVNAGLELKVDTDNLISEINASADIIRLIGQRLIIQMQNFSLSETGYMNAIAGQISGFILQNNKFSRPYNTIYNFTTQDVQILMGYLNSYNSLSSGLQSLYNLVGDASLNVLDVVKMINIINGDIENETNVSGEASINSNDSNRLIEITNSLNVNKTRFGIFSIYSYLLSADIISLTDANISDINGIILDKNKKQITLKSLTNETIILPTGITTPTVTQTSREEDKKDFNLLDNALEEVINTDIYTYHLKSQGKDDKKHVGFVIGKDFKYSHLITAEDENKNEIGVDPYSMTSVLWKAVQEQQKEIEELKKEIKLLKGEK